LKIAFRIDISPEIGTGHYVRMSALAEAFVELGHTYEFFKSEDEPVDYSNFDIIVVDSYEVSSEYIAKLNTPNQTLVCYDDNALYTYNCDILINANLYAKELNFKFGNTPSYMLLGGEYALLRGEFQNISPITIKEKATRVFVCFGGSDLRNTTPRIIESLQDIAGVKLSVALGGSTKCDDEVYTLAKKNVTIYKTPESICEIMHNCDIAVTSSGSMVYELAVLGLPAITISQAENQFFVAEYMLRKGLMKNVGNWKNVDFDYVKKEVQLLLDDTNRRKFESAKLVKMVNKNGAVNAAKEIVRIAKRIKKEIKP
jgi:spore coat polysaccharide biosynthesis predicted glycosyltransferase SpsG